MNSMNGNERLFKPQNRKINIAFFQNSLLIVNYCVVVYLCTLCYCTSEFINQNYEAREFLESVRKVPGDPGRILMVCTFLMGILVCTTLIRQNHMLSGYWLGVTQIADLLVCAIIICQMEFNYNGLLLLIFANIIAYTRGRRSTAFFITFAIAGYLLSDHRILSNYFLLFDYSDYINYYPYKLQQIFLAVYYLLQSTNILLFIWYCVYIIEQQRNTIEEVNSLYNELQLANEQLKEYADMSEKMAQTKERNRLAREIHDTLGHTLTGIAVGLDACMALIEIDPNLTKKQLEKLSHVSREGIKDIRRSVNELRPDSLERLNLDVAIRKMITDMSHMSNTKIYFDTNIRKLKFAEDEENAIYRVIQESITNSLRHGKATRIWITLNKVDGEIQLVIRDNGEGCVDMKSGFGTRHIRERIEMLRGTVSFDGRNGFTVTANIPIRWGKEYD